MSGSDEAEGGEANAPPGPSAAEERQNLEALRRWAGRPQPVKAKVEVGEDGGLSIGAPHDDVTSYAVRVADAVGTSSTAFALRQVDHLAAMIPASNKNPERALNGMLAAVEGVKPENEAEGMLATQMAATHSAAMSCLARVAQAETMPNMEAAGKLASRLLRTYTMQVEALTKMRRDGEQKVKVEHVHVYEGGQAIVGNVETGGGGTKKHGSQPHAPLDPRALAFAPVEPLLCDDAGREPVPVPRGEREGALPNARRRQG